MVIVGGGEIYVADSNDASDDQDGSQAVFLGGNELAMHRNYGAQGAQGALAAALGDRQRSEGAIFETPRDDRDKSARPLNSSLLKIAGALNFSKPEANASRIAGPSSGGLISGS